MNKKDALIKVIVVWLVANAVTGFVGFLDEICNVKTYPIHRIEVVFPGYRFGRWIMKPLYSSPINPEEKK